MGKPPQRKMPLTGARDRRTFMEQERNPNKNAERRSREREER